jgi:hypothetical protein
MEPLGCERITDIFAEVVFQGYKSSRSWILELASLIEERDGNDLGVKR